MNYGNINLITPPDRLFTDNLSYLLIQPSKETKVEFQRVLSEIHEEINVHIYDENDSDITWLLAVALTVDLVIIDIDNCDDQCKMFISYLLSKKEVYYLTKDETTPWHMINKNRVFNLDFLVVDNDEDDDDDTEEQ